MALFNVTFLLTLFPFYTAYATTSHKPCRCLSCTSLCINISWYAVHSKCYIDFFSAKRILKVKTHRINKHMTIYTDKIRRKISRLTTSVSVCTKIYFFYFIRFMCLFYQIHVLSLVNFFSYTFLFIKLCRWIINYI